MVAFECEVTPSIATISGLPCSSMTAIKERPWPDAVLSADNNQNYERLIYDGISLKSICAGLCKYGNSHTHQKRTPAPFLYLNPSSG